MPSLKIELDPETYDRLTEHARLLGLTPEQAAASLLRDVGSRLETNLDAHIDRILNERRELLERLAR